MSDVLVQRRRPSTVIARPAAHRPLPVGVGLALGAGASLVMWAGIAWAILRVM